jgi:L-asparaginase
MDRRIVIVATGGTIANTDQGRIPIETVLADIERASGRAPEGRVLEIKDTLREGAETFTPNEWLIIQRAVQTSVDRDDVDGVIVTHGTYTAEETAYFLHLTVDTRKPVVVVCSQRKHGTVGNDGDRNLLDAMRAAGDDALREQGVVVLLNEELHCARDVTKVNQRPSGFRTGLYGILGSIEADRVSLYRSPVRKHTFRSGLTRVERLPRVDIVATYAGAGGEAIDAFVAAGAAGLVINGFSFSGKPHHLQLAALEAARERGIPVVLANRGGDGRVPTEPGDRFVRGDNLTAQKARVLLMAALGRGVTDIQRVFDEY